MSLKSYIPLSCPPTIASGLGVAVRGDGGVAGEGRVVGVSKFHSLGKCTMPSTLRLDVQCFLWPVYYIKWPTEHKL